MKANTSLLPLKSWSRRCPKIKLSLQRSSCRIWPKCGRGRRVDRVIGNGSGTGGDGNEVGLVVCYVIEGYENVDGDALFVCELYVDVFAGGSIPGVAETSTDKNAWNSDTERKHRGTCGVGHRWLLSVRYIKMGRLNDEKGQFFLIVCGVLRYLRCTSKSAHKISARNIQSRSGVRDRVLGDSRKR